MVRLEGRKCVVVGAGKIAADKISGLLHHGAKVLVVSPHAVARVQKQARERAITWQKREFSPRDVRQAFLVIAATDFDAVNEAVFRACRARGILCNAVDQPERCDFFYPAVVRRGSLQIAISTNGQSPALAARLRRELEKQFGPEWSEWVEHVGNIRRKLLSEELTPQARRRRLLQMGTEEAFREFLNTRR
jgi:siroheme synthase-like protein